MKTPIEYLAEVTGYSADALMNEYRDHDIITPTEALEAMVMMCIDYQIDYEQFIKEQP